MAVTPACQCRRSRDELRFLLTIVKEDLDNGNPLSSVNHFTALFTMPPGFADGTDAAQLQEVRQLVGSGDTAECVLGLPVGKHPVTRGGCDHARTEAQFLWLAVGAALMAASLWVQVGQKPDGPVSGAIGSAATLFTVLAVGMVLRGPWDCCRRAGDGAVKSLVVFATMAVLAIGWVAIGTGIGKDLAVLQRVGVSFVGGAASAWTAAVSAWKRQRYDRTKLDKHMESLVATGSKVRLFVALIAGGCLFFLPIVLFIVHDVSCTDVAPSTAATAQKSTGTCGSRGDASHVLMYVAVCIFALPGFGLIAVELLRWSWQTGDLLDFIKRPVGTVCGIVLLVTPEKRKETRIPTANNSLQDRLLLQQPRPDLKSLLS